MLQDPVTAAQSVLALAIFSSLFWFAFDNYSRTILVKHRRLIFAAILFVLVWRISPSNGVFYGLEYEGSYIYNVAGRQAGELRKPHDNDNLSFLIDVCAVGSLDSCYLSETSSGHYVGYPSLIRSAKALFGDGPNITYYINLLA